MRNYLLMGSMLSMILIGGKGCSSNYDYCCTSNDQCEPTDSEGPHSCSMETCGKCVAVTPVTVNVTDWIDPVVGQKNYRMVLKAEGGKPPYTWVDFTTVNNTKGKLNWLAFKVDESVVNKSTAWLTNDIVNNEILAPIEKTAADDKLTIKVTVKDYTRHVINNNNNNEVDHSVYTFEHSIAINDLTVTCGDGIFSVGETCDSAIAAGQVGACPTSCDDNNSCTTDTMVGSVQTCDVACDHQAITQCIAGDGCCPSGCTHDSDNDCSGACGTSLSCDDDNPCTQDGCDSKNGVCVHNTLLNHDQVSCDPDGLGTDFTNTDGVCTSDMTCLRLICRPCENDQDCLDGHCVCADGTCSTKRCYDRTPLCQYLKLTDDSSGCNTVNTPAQRWGEGCNGSAVMACDSQASCTALKCVTCSYTGCTFTQRDTDCGTSSSCGKCSGINQCLVYNAGTGCSTVGSGVGCEDRCDGNGNCLGPLQRPCGTAPCDSTCTTDYTCSSKNQINCGGSSACRSVCLDGTCHPSSSACGSGDCTGVCAGGVCNSNGRPVGFCHVCDETGTSKYQEEAACGSTPCDGKCVSGVCNSNGKDCGTCCKCDSVGNPTFDSSQNGDCFVYQQEDDPCHHVCTAIYTCGGPPTSTTCGEGDCAGHCTGQMNSNGWGVCSTDGNNCRTADGHFGMCMSDVYFHGCFEGIQ
jgi:hypothetical protein